MADRRRSVLLDCDPGIDDAMALALLMAHPSVELVAVTTVAGNVPLQATTDNALRLVEFFGDSTVPVYAGADRPLRRPARSARHVHGLDGLGGAPIPSATGAAGGGFAADVVVQLLRERPGEIDLIAVGPLTNIALALDREPRIAAWARSIVLMGGSYTRGNVTPAAEFNFFADPEAAAAVFAAPWQPVQIGLDVTLRARVDGELMARWSQYGALSDRLLVPALGNYLDSRTLSSGDDGLRDPTLTSRAPAIHDACAAAYLIDPAVFDTAPALIRIETQGRWTTGMSVVDFRMSGPPDDQRRGEHGAQANSRVATGLDLHSFWAMMSAAFETIAIRVRVLTDDEAAGGG